MNSKTKLKEIKEAFYHNHLGKGCDNDFVYDLIEEYGTLSKPKHFGKKK